MEKQIRKILFIIFIVMFFVACMSKVYASEASISANNVNVGENFTVTVNIPQDVIGYTGNITVNFSDGSSESGNLYGLGKDMNNLESDYYWPGNASKSFNAKVAGNATIVVSNLVLSDKNGTKVNSQNTLTATISITEQQPETPPTTTTPDTNTETPPTTNTKPPEQTPPKNITFKDTNEKVYTTKRVNIRQGYGTSSLVIQTLAEGIELTRTGIGSESVDGYAWSRVSYNGITGYVITSALTTEAPVKPEEPDEVEQPPEEETPNEDEQPPEENTEENEEVKKIAEELGSIPAVGEEKVLDFFAISVAVTIYIVLVFKYNIHNKKYNIK